MVLCCSCCYLVAKQCLNLYEPIEWGKLKACFCFWGMVEQKEKDG